MSAGGGVRWINAIRKLRKGDRVFALIKGKGYVGYGVVEQEAVPVKEFRIKNRLIIDDLPRDHRWRQAKDPMTDEWMVAVRWVKTFDENNAQWFKGAFANQNVVCKLRDQNTFRFLVEKFGVDVSDM